MKVSKEQLDELVEWEKSHKIPGKFCTCEIHVKSVQDFKDNLRVNDVMNVGWRHEHCVVKVDRDGFWDFCITGDCGDLMCERIDYSEVPEDAFEEIWPIINTRGYDPFGSWRWDEVAKRLMIN